jgi:uncharacterized protein (DUF362 family)
MKKLSRREFLRLAALASGGLVLQQFLASCGLQPPAASITTQSPLSPTATPFAPGVDEGIGTEAVPQSGESSPTATASLLPDLVVVRQGEPEDMVRRALASLGGMSAFVFPGARVVIKPNICNAYHSYEFASTTNPWVVGALVKLSLEVGASSVTVFDFPFGGTAADAYKRSGIREQVEAAGGRMEVMSNLKFVPVSIPNALTLKNTQAYQDALEADVLINVPIAKQHGSTRLSLGMKNLMGLIKDRNYLHTIGLGKAIADLTSLFRPELTVMDAVRILTANGPTGGDLADVRQMDTIIVAPDIVAVDSYTTSLFGLAPADIRYIQEGAAMGLGRSDLSALNIEVIDL